MPKRRDPSSARLFNVRVAVRASDLEEFRADAHSRQISVSLLLFQRLMSARPVAALDASVAAELGRIGSNLNQLARRANSGQVIGNTNPKELKDLHEVIRKLRITLLGGSP